MASPLTRRKRPVLLLGLGAGCALVVLTWQSFSIEGIAHPSSTLLPLLALTLLLPTALAPARTHSGPAWATLGPAGTLAANWRDYTPLLPDLLFAASLLHRLAYTGGAFQQELPATILGLNDDHQLPRAFAWTLASCHNPSSLDPCGLYFQHHATAGRHLESSQTSLLYQGSTLVP